MISNLNNECSSKVDNEIIITDCDKEIIDMKGITKRKDGRYIVRLQKNKIQITKYAKTKELAIKLYRQLKNQKELTKPKTKQIEKRITVCEWYEKWLKEYKEKFVTQKTLSVLKGAMNKFINKIKNISLRELTTEIIQKELNKLEHNRTKERIWVYLNALLQKACDIGLLAINPFRAVVKEKKKVYKNFCYTFDEQQIIVNKAKDYNIEHEMMIYLMTGCRPSELPNKGQFDFKNNIINIYGTKNDNARHREVEMSRSFSDYMQEYFINNEVKNHDYVKTQFKKLCEENKIPNCKLYRLRHTFATNHFTLGTNAKYVQHWLGHYGIQLTLDTYTDIDKKSTKEKIKKLYNNFYYEI